MLACRVAESIRAGLEGNNSPGGSHVAPMVSTTVPVSLGAPCCPKALEHLPCEAVGTHLPASCPPVAKTRPPKENPRRT